MRRNRWCRFLPLLSVLLLALPARAQDERSPLDTIVGEARGKLVESMRAEAAKVGIEIAPDPTFTEVDGAISAFAPAKGIENLELEDLKRGVTLGLLIASTPEGSEAPSGVFRVRAQASEDGQGTFTILDSAGNVVQEGDFEIEANEGAKAVNALGGTLPKFAIYSYYRWGCITYVYHWPWGTVYIRYCWCWWPYNFWYGGCYYHPYPHFLWNHFR